MEEMKYTRRKFSDIPKRTFSSASIGSYTGGSSKLDIRAPVVIEIGQRLTRVGFAGEFIPRDIFFTKYVDAMTMKTHSIFDDSYSEHEQYFILVNFFKEIVFRRLLTTVNERRLIVVENVLAPTKTRNAIAKALFECPSLAPHSVLFAPSHLLCSFPFNTKNCLVVDIGARESLLFPIAEGCLMLAQYESSSVGVSAVEKNLRKLLRQHAQIRSALTEKHEKLEVSPLRKVEEEDLEVLQENGTVEDIIVRFCFATSMDRGLKIQKHVVDDAEEVPEPPPDVEIPFGTDMLILPGFIREAAAEVLFTEGACDDRSVPQIILDAILRIPIDLRKVFFSKLLVVGGIVRMRGFLHRLKSELLRLISDEKGEYFRHLHGLKDVAFFRFADDINLELYCGWLGGSMFGSCDVLDGRAITREEWMAQPAGNRNVPDWTNKVDSYLKLPDNGSKNR